MELNTGIMKTKIGDIQVSVVATLTTDKTQRDIKKNTA